jgi:triacylglycerol lipase
LVASVTSIGGVNKGSRVADNLLNIFKPGTGISYLAEKLFNGLGITISKLEGNPTLPQNVRNALNSLSTTGTLEFNKLHPWGVPPTPCGEGDYTARGVAYYSWSSVWKKSIFSSTFSINPFDLPLSTTSFLAFGNEDNDGLVGRCSSHLGKVIKDDYPMHHAHQINQAFGLKPSNVNPVQLYRDHANRLKTAGF